MRDPLAQRGVRTRTAGQVRSRRASRSSLVIRTCTDRVQGIRTGIHAAWRHQGGDLPEFSLLPVPTSFGPVHQNWISRSRKPGANPGAASCAAAVESWPGRRMPDYATTIGRPLRDRIGASAVQRSKARVEKGCPDDVGRYSGTMSANICQPSTSPASISSPSSGEPGSPSASRSPGRSRGSLRQRAPPGSVNSTIDRSCSIGQGYTRPMPKGRSAGRSRCERP